MSDGRMGLKRRRLVAFLVDAPLAFALLPIVPVVFTTRLEGNWWDWMLPWGIGLHLLHTLLGHLIWRKTLGKKLVGLSVVNRRGWGYIPRLIVREAIKAVSLSIIALAVFFAIAGIAAVIASGWRPSGAIFPAEFIIFGYLVLFGPPTAVIVCPAAARKDGRALHDLLSCTAVVEGEEGRFPLSRE